MPGSQIVWCKRIKKIKRANSAKIRRARLGKGGGEGAVAVAVSPQPPRVFRISLY